MNTLRNLHFFRNIQANFVYFSAQAPKEVPVVESAPSIKTPSETVQKEQEPKPTPQNLQKLEDLVKISECTELVAAINAQSTLVGNNILELNQTLSKKQDTAKQAELMTAIKSLLQAKIEKMRSELGTKQETIIQTTDLDIDIYVKPATLLRTLQNICAASTPAQMIAQIRNCSEVLNNKEIAPLIKKLEKSTHPEKQAKLMEEIKQILSIQIETLKIQLGEIQKKIQQNKDFFNNSENLIAFLSTAPLELQNDLWEKIRDGIITLIKTKPDDFKQVLNKMNPELQTKILSTMMALDIIKTATFDELKNILTACESLPTGQKESMKYALVTFVYKNEIENKYIIKQETNDPKKLFILESKSTPPNSPDQSNSLTTFINTSSIRPYILHLFKDKFGGNESLEGTSTENAEVSELKKTIDSFIKTTVKDEKQKTELQQMLENPARILMSPFGFLATIIGLIAGGKGGRLLIATLFGASALLQAGGGKAINDFLERAKPTLAGAEKWLSEQWNTLFTGKNISPEITKDFETKDKIIFYKLKEMSIKDIRALKDPQSEQLTQLLGDNKAWYDPTKYGGDLVDLIAGIDANYITNIFLNKSCISAIINDRNLNENTTLLNALTKLRAETISQSAPITTLPDTIKKQNDGSYKYKDTVITIETIPALRAGPSKYIIKKFGDMDVERVTTENDLKILENLYKLGNKENITKVVKEENNFILTINGLDSNGFKVSTTDGTAFSVELLNVKNGQQNLKVEVAVDSENKKLKCTPEDILEKIATYTDLTGTLTFTQDGMLQYDGQPVIDILTTVESANQKQTDEQAKQAQETAETKETTNIENITKILNITKEQLSSKKDANFIFEYNENGSFVNISFNGISISVNSARILSTDTHPLSKPYTQTETPFSILKFLDKIKSKKADRPIIGQTFDDTLKGTHIEFQTDGGNPEVDLTGENKDLIDEIAEKLMTSWFYGRMPDSKSLFEKGRYLPIQKLFNSNKSTFTSLCRQVADSYLISHIPENIFNPFYIEDNNIMFAEMDGSDDSLAKLKPDTLSFDNIKLSLRNLPTDIEENTLKYYIMLCMNKAWYESIVKKG